MVVVQARDRGAGAGTGWQAIERDPGRRGVNSVVVRSHVAATRGQVDSLMTYRGQGFSSWCQRIDRTQSGVLGVAVGKSESAEFGGVNALGKQGRRSCGLLVLRLGWCPS